MQVNQPRGRKAGGIRHGGTEACCRGQSASNGRSSSGKAFSSATASVKPSQGQRRLPQAYGQHSRPVGDGHGIVLSTSTEPVGRSALRRPRAWLSTKAYSSGRGAVDPLGWFGNRTVQIGIESEFEINPYPREDPRFKGTFKNLVKALADDYHDQVETDRPRMRQTLRPYDYRGSYDMWCFVFDPTVFTGPHSLIGIELVSPILTIAPGSRWREDVKVFWTFLQKYFQITANKTCGTHIHVSLEPCYTLQEIKRIAQALIHFETAFEELAPPDRRDNRAVKSNWIDSPAILQRERSRWQLISDIEAEVEFDRVVELMQKRGDRNYCWNFWSFSRSRTLEFRKPPACTTPEEVLGWAELASSFVQASVQYGTLQRLKRVPANVGGLRWFIMQFESSGVNEPDRLQAIWAGKDPNAALEPPIPSLPISASWTWDKKKKFETRMKALVERDRTQSGSHAETAREPYW